MSKSQRLTWMLAAAGLLLLGLTLAEFFGLGSGYSLSPDSKGERPVAQALKLDEGARKLAPWPEYGSDMLARPIFNEDRKPTPVSAKANGQAEAQPLKAALTGVIISGDFRLAMVRDESSTKTVRLKPGQNLPGEQSPWKLVDVRPRSATFEAAGLGQQELKLQVSDKPNAAPPVQAQAQNQAPAPGQPPAGQPQAAPPQQPGDAFYSQMKAMQPPQGDVNPDEIRRRIEERRKQLREEAQRMEKEQKH